MKLALGTAQFGMKYGIANRNGKIPSSNEIGSILNLSRLHNIDTIDTAMSYGNSEKSLGNHDLSDFKVVTKLPEIPKKINNISDWVINNLNNSLNNLKLDNLHCLMLHRPEQLTGESSYELLSALQSIKESGKVLKLGISIYSPEELMAISDLNEIDIVQCPINIVDRRMIESGWLGKLKKNNIEIHARSCFLQGLLLMDIDELPSRFSKWEEIWVTWKIWMKKNNCSALDGCLSFLNSVNDVNRIIVGIDTLKQLEEIIFSYNSNGFNDYPEISSSDENLINPTLWKEN